MFNIRHLLAALVTLLCVQTAAAADDAAPRPRVRAITAFVRVADIPDPQLAEALKVLADTRTEFAKQGYEVETVRIVTQPLPELMAGRSAERAFELLKRIAALSEQQKFIANVGPAMLRDADDPKAIRLLSRVLSSLPTLNASAIIADEDGIHWNAVRETAALIRYVADHSAQGQANFNFTASAMVKPLGPFYPSAYHTGPGRQFSIAFESANIVQGVFARTHGNFAESVPTLTHDLSASAKQAESIGNKIGAAHGWTFAGVDPTPAPLGDISIGAAIESYTGAQFGSSGTLTASLIITTAVKAVPVKQVGFSGLMLPVMEDKVIAKRWADGTINTDSLLAYSAVCGTGLDTLPYPGDISEEQMRRILGDVAALAFKWHKPLTARLLPVPGKKAGDSTEFSSRFLFNTRLHAAP